MIDFHTHILPDIDDGSCSVEESVRMIEVLVEQGVKKIILTPHFYAYCSSIERFTEKRKMALKELVKALKEQNIDVELYLGSEVLFFDDLWRIEDIEELCIVGTRYILLEMPFTSWENSAVDHIINLANRGIIPVLAHFERYIKYRGNMPKIREMMRAGVVVQRNCDYLNKVLTKGKALRLIKKGSIFALGTDCHNLGDRKPDFEGIESLLSKKLDKMTYDRFTRRQSSFIKGATRFYP